MKHRRPLLALGLLLAMSAVALPSARSQVVLDIVANPDYSVVTMTLSGSYGAEGLSSDIVTSNLGLAGFSTDVSAGIASSDSTLTETAGATTANYWALAYDVAPDNSYGIFLESSIYNTYEPVSSYDFGGTATFDLSTMAGVGNATSGSLYFYQVVDGSPVQVPIGTWNLTVAQIPEPETIPLACMGIGLAAFALRRRLAAA